MKQTFKKYTTIFTLGVKDAIAYRNEMLVWTILESTPLISMLILWLTIFRDHDSIGNYTQSSIITYYLIGHIVHQLTGSHTEENAIKTIQEGSFSKHLLRPLNIKLYFITNQLGWRVMTLITGIFPLLLFSFFFLRSYLPTPSLMWLFIPLFLAIGYLFDNIFSLFIIAMGFVFEQARSFIHLRWMLTWLFAGSMMPFDLMPTYLAQLAQALPFKFRYFTPVQLIVGNLTLTETITQLAFAALWLTLLTFLLRLLWNRNLKNYTAVG